MYSNESTAGEVEDTPTQDHLALLIVLYVFVSIIGIVGNVSLMAALASSGACRLRTPQLLSACAADLLVCAASAPLAAARAAHLHRLPCHVTHYIESFPVAASTLSLVAMATDRCGAVLRGRENPLCARPYVAVAAVWVAAFILGAVMMIATCVSCPPLAAAHAVVTYCIPVVAVMRCHWAVRVKLTALSLTARAAHGELPLPVPLIRRPTHVIIVAGVGRERRDAVDVGDTRSKKKLQPSLLGPQPQTSTLRSRRRLGNVLVAISLIFAACWCPHATFVISSAFGVRVPAAAAQYALLLGHAHSALNAAAYWLLNRHALTAACVAWRMPQLRVREERPSSTNEAALGAFHPRLARPAPSPRPPPSSFLY
ncbi:PREDICTED: apelin receptor [Papilio xuthus]|uniref:Apelin receptor n=1 Tax=Papilio xuthus TaxID=66420 RepID=A0AAJ6ZNA2_PAPXU|nr:PREDICTED: apelin receptor [Papilio xuthus]XP_013176123.1 PREDICTED: apelin receptor [Papilio xuthus]